MWLVDAIRKTSNVLYLCKEGFEILHEQWLSLLVIQHIICHTERVSKLWLFFCNLRVNIDGNGHSVTHRWQTNAIGSTSICLICINKFETVHIQWLLVGTVHHPNHYHDSVYTKIWHFVCKLRVDFDKDNGTVIPTSGSEMLSEASFIYLMYQRKV